MSDETRKMETPRRTSLGRGLSALFGEDPPVTVTAEPGKTPRDVPIEFVHPGRYQPRRHFDDEQMAGLVESIREKGILQPLLVRREVNAPDTFEIIAGERRWRAAQKAGLHVVPVLVRDLTDSDALEIALIENIQRQDLTPLEEAEGFRRLMDDFAHTQDELAKIVGKSRSHIANTMRLLALPDPLKEMVQTGILTAGHARALLTAEDPIALAQKVVELGLNVRQTEELARLGASKDRPRKEPVEKDADLLNLEDEISTRIGLKVAIAPKGKKGTITIHYQTLDQLDDVLRRLGQDDH